MSGDGMILTNEHVSGECGMIRVYGARMTLLATDPTFDFGLAQRRRNAHQLCAFAASLAGLNADITVAGYPLDEILSGLHVTRDTITSVRGVGG